ncbi:MAG: flagellar motor switch protein FliN [Nitrospina sp.]|nr:flagellar motor switch protein FliN [Nitrospina sp.]
MEDESAKEDLEALEDVDEKGEADNVGDTGEAGEEGEETDTPTGEKKSLDLILDIPLTVTVELGRNKMLINDLLQLGQGSVIELKKLVGEPLEVLVNQKLVARGETVVVNEKFGVRLTDIVSPMERVKSLT